MEYEDRIVVFIDLLGFKDLLKNTVNTDGSDNVDAIKSVIEAYETIREVWNLDGPREEYLKSSPMGSKMITTFSDSIVISFLANEKSEIFYTLLEIKWMIMRLIDKGILCRGAVSYGKFIHLQNYLFGPALVEAYLLESKAANYPRIILDRSIIDIAGEASSDHHNSEDEIKFVESLLEKDLDGMYYIDYFTKAQTELDDPQYGFPLYIEKLADKIRYGMNISKTPNKADLRVKFLWMKEKYNSMIEIVKNKKFLDSVEKIDYELYDFYKNLNKINPTTPVKILKRRGK